MYWKAWGGMEENAMGAFPAECFRLLQQYYPDVVELKDDAQGRLYAIWANTPMPTWDHDQRLVDIDRAGVDIEIKL